MSVIVGEWYVRKGQERAHRLKAWPIRGEYRTACGALTLPEQAWEPARWHDWQCWRCEKIKPPPATGEGSARVLSS